MCYVHDASNKQDHSKELTAEQWIHIAREARDMGMVFALLTGGEPFLRKDIFQIIKGMSDLGLSISINSNGSLITEQVLEQLLRTPPFRMNISLYGGSCDTYRQMCGQDAFEQVVRNIRTLKEAGVDVRLNHSITPYNRHDLARIRQIARELGLNLKVASYMYPPVRINGERYGCADRLTPEEAAGCSVEWDLLRLSQEQYMAHAQSVLRGKSMEGSDCAVEQEQGIGCRAGTTTFWMTWDGRMTPCGMMPQPVVYPLQTGFAEAWQQLRAQVRQLRRPSQCICCEHRDLCNACAAVCVTETGAFDRVPTYACQQTKAYIEQTRKAYLERTGADHGAQETTDQA
jgi:MoaA/NifB/PqqE/SkfB family radical SAM enzyme